MCRQVPARVEAECTAGSAWTHVASIHLDPAHRLLGVEVQVSAACSARLLSPLGYVAWSATASGAGMLGTVLDAPFENYRLQVQATSGAVAVTAALTAR